MRGTLERHIWTQDGASYVPARHRKACAYDAFVPYALATLDLSVGGELAGIVADAEAAVRDLQSGDQRQLSALARLLLRTEAIASSKIEGMQVGVREFARAEARYDVGQSVGPESRAILAGIDTMQHAIDTAARVQSITPDRLLDIHRVLMEAAAAWTTPGVFRHHQNWIGGNDFNPCGADFVPPPPDLVEGLVTDLCEFCNDASLPAVIQAAIAHAQFETIHPFNDGNGRTGRVLVHVLLRRRGVTESFVPPISVVLAADRDRYIEGLAAFRRDSLDAWIEQFAIAAAESAVIAGQYLTDVVSLQARWRAALGALDHPPRADAAAWQLIEALPAHPVLTGPVATMVLGRSKPSTNQAITQLVAAGVLVPLSRGARNRSWEAAGLLDIVAAVEQES